MNKKIAKPFKIRRLSSPYHFDAFAAKLIPALFMIAVVLAVMGLALGFLIAPNKFYCLTFAAMGLYILLDEVLWMILNRVKMKQQKINFQTSDLHQKADK